MYDKKLAEYYGITEEQTKGKTDTQVRQMMKKAAEEYFRKEDEEEEKTYYGNMDKAIKQLSGILETPLEAYVGKVGSKMSKTLVSVIGYDSSSKEIIVKFNDKLYSIAERYFIRNEDDIETVSALVKNERDEKKKEDEGKIKVSKSAAEQPKINK